MAEFNSGCVLVFLQECLEPRTLSFLASGIKVKYHMMWVSFAFLERYTMQVAPWTSEKGQLRNRCWVDTCFSVIYF